MRVSASCFYDENVKIGSENVVLIILWYKAFQALLSVKCQNQESLYTCLLLLLKSTLFVIWTQSNEKKIFIYLCVTRFFKPSFIHVCLMYLFMCMVHHQYQEFSFSDLFYWVMLFVFEIQKLSMHRKWLILAYEEIVKYSVQKIVYRI